MNDNDDMADSFGQYDRSSIGLRSVEVCFVNSVTHRQSKKSVNSRMKSQDTFLLVITYQSLRWLASALHLTFNERLRQPRLGLSQQQQWGTQQRRFERILLECHGVQCVQRVQLELQQ